jgi:[ribosomal protein S18]-alanine N-acetyltransferase
MIRDLTARDSESVRRLLSDAPEAAQWCLEDLCSASQTNFSWRVAEEEGAVCGLVVFRIAGDEAEILNLAVDLSRRRRGTGSQLMQDAIQACQAAGVTRIFLEVRNSNECARKFYMRMGFSEAGRRRQYYREPLEDALVLVRKVE